MKIEKCKGFEDLAPQEMCKFRFIENVFKETCMQWGYQEVRTPALEYLYLFTSAGTLTPGMLRRVYSFLDWDGWSGERVVLKPDGTIPVARFYIENVKKGLARLSYVTNILIFEETGKKSREKWQCGVELIGENTVIADGELIALALDILHRMGMMDVKVLLSHAGLIRAILEDMELPLKEKDRIFDQILDGDIKTLEYLKPDKPELIQVLRLLTKQKGKTPGLLKNIKVISAKKLPKFKPALDNFTSVVEILEEINCEYQIDLASCKGFEYYTGIIFHFSIGREIIGGGGRYDELIPLMGGRNIPAAGFALYVDNLIRKIRTEDTQQPKEKCVSVSITTKTVRECFKLADLLREFGLLVQLSLIGKQIADCGWYIEINTESPKYIVTNMGNGKKYVADNANKIPPLLGCK